jgi:hypothetical protein
VDDALHGVAFITRDAADKRALNAARGEAKIFPIVVPQADSLDLYSQSNLMTPLPMRAIGRGLSHEALLCSIYALLNSQTYLARNADALRLDYPKFPVPVSTDLLKKLAALGSDLVALHLFESPKLEQQITTYFGPKNPKVGRVGWSNDTVWLDSGVPKKGKDASPGTIGFRGVLDAVWSFHIGGYQVCENWLKDRKGRTLSNDDIAHYQKIVVALAETIRLMKEIDEVIEAHGGWPGAFRTCGSVRAEKR